MFVKLSRVHRFISVHGNRKSYFCNSLSRLDKLDVFELGIDLFDQSSALLDFLCSELGIPSDGHTVVFTFPHVYWPNPFFSDMKNHIQLHVA